MSKKIKSLSKLIKYISKLGKTKNDGTVLFFRGEQKYYKDTELVPKIYRNKYINNEEKIYRETQLFNDQEFITDNTAFDKLSRIQHYTAPTRLLDISEDLLSSIYFAIGEKDILSDKEKLEKEAAYIYIFEIKEKSIKYYDSDTVSVISNLAKIPLENNNEKSKRRLLCDSMNIGIKKFNKQKSANFLRHEIREEKPQFEAIINPKHLTSIQCVRPKLTNNRIKFQKGLFLLFGLNSNNVEKPIRIFENDKLIESNNQINHPIKKIHKIKLNFKYIKKMKKELKTLGIRTPFIYPEIDKVSEYLNNEYK